MRDEAELVEMSQRAELVNCFLVAVSWGPRHFFGSRGAVARFDVGLDGRPFLLDSYTRRQVDVQRPRSKSWRFFSNGGTLRRLIEALANFIVTGKHMPRHHLGPWPDSFHENGPWGYGEEDMALLRKEAESLGIIEPEGGTPDA